MQFICRYMCLKCKNMQKICKNMYNLYVKYAFPTLLMCGLPISQAPSHGPLYWPRRTSLSTQARRRRRRIRVPGQYWQNRVSQSWHRHIRPCLPGPMASGPAVLARSAIGNVRAVDYEFPVHKRTRRRIKRDLSYQ